MDSLQRYSTTTQRIDEFLKFRYSPSRLLKDLSVAKGAKGPSVDIIREIVSLGGRGLTLDAWMTDNFEALKVELRPRRLDWDVRVS